MGNHDGHSNQPPAVILYELLLEMLDVRVGGCEPVRFQVFLCRIATPRRRHDVLPSQVLQLRNGTVCEYIMLYI